jgi:hypothetical protein
MIRAASPAPLPDGRQSETAAAIQRGAGRLLRALGHAVLTELPLASGHRADLVSIDAGGEIAIVEIKSCLQDFRCDRKWGEYLAHCDRFYFAVTPDFPREALPDEPGLIIADRFAAEFVRPAPLMRLRPQERKALHLRFARAAAMRLHALHDPGVASGM